MSIQYAVPGLQGDLQEANSLDSAMPGINGDLNQSSGGASGELTLTEENDTLAATSSGGSNGELTLTEENDTLAATMGGQIVATLAVTEAADTLAATNTEIVTATLAITEAADSLTAAAAVRVSALFARTEGADTLVAVAAISVDVISPTYTTLTVAAAECAISGGGLVATSELVILSITGACSVDGWASGKYYFECLATLVDAGDVVGIGNTTDLSSGGSLGTPGSTGKISWAPDGSVNCDGLLIGTAAAYSNSNQLSFATDLFARLIWFRVGSGDWNGDPGADPAIGAGGFTFNALDAIVSPFVQLVTNGDSVEFNFGQNPFAEIVPAGFSPGWPVVPASITVAGHPNRPLEFPFVAVEFDLKLSGSDVTLRLCNRGPLFKSVAGALVQYDPRLLTPILLGNRISFPSVGIGTNSFSLPTRITPNGGTISFRLDVGTWITADYIWMGRVFRVYTGVSAAGRVEDLTLVYTGIIAGLTADGDAMTATVRTTDASSLLDKVLVADLYNKDFSSSLKGRPKPQVWGRVFNIQPVLEQNKENDFSANYAVSKNSPLLEAVTEVRVGGIPWDPVASDPGGGQWAPWFDGANLIGFTLGGATDGGDVRCDARATGWDTLTTPDLITLIVNGGGQSVDLDAMAEFRYMNGGDFVGYHTSTAPISRLQALDDIATSNNSWWGVGLEGKFIAGGHDNPGTGNYGFGAFSSIGEVEIASIALAEVIPPAWRIRVEWERNWQPESQFFGAVTAEEQRRLSSSGTELEILQDDLVLAKNPLAVDVPTIGGLYWRVAGAYEVRTRLIRAWGVDATRMRRIYDVTAWVRPEEVTLYMTLTVDHPMVPSGRLFRVISVVRSIGGGPQQLQIWG